MIDGSEYDISQNEALVIASRTHTSYQHLHFTQLRSSASARNPYQGSLSLLVCFFCLDLRKSLSRETINFHTCKPHLTAYCNLTTQLLIPLCKSRKPPTCWGWAPPFTSKDISKMILAQATAEN